MLLRLAHVMESAIDPALEIMPRHMDSMPARVMLLAIGLQESGFEHRRQMGGGPARGFWQFEPGSKETRAGVWGVYLHRASHEHLRLLCHYRDVSFDPHPIWHRLEDDDVLAAGVARLLLWTDYRPLPANDVKASWNYYKRNWRPGKPKPKTWPRFYRLATDEVLGVQM